MIMIYINDYDEELNLIQFTHYTYLQHYHKSAL